MILKERTVLITGGSRGIGRAIALECAKAGATVCINYSKNKQKAEETLVELQKISSQDHRMVQFNVSNASEVEKGMEASLKKSGIDVLINNAGITKDGLLLMMKEESWDEVIDVNLKGVFLCSKIAAKYMLKKRYGRIINIASTSGEAGNPGQANYAASKAGVIGFTKSLAKELASRSITVNAVSPGYVESDMTTLLSDELKKKVIEQIPLSRFGSCEEISHLVVFLASDKASYITGQVIGVNGGLYV